jgi:hypothetical protein
MIHRTRRVLACLMVLCSVVAIPVSAASASDASIKAAIRSYNPRLLVDEGHFVTAIGEYKTSHNPSGVQAALAASIATIDSLKSKIAAQPAIRHRVKAGKAKLQVGLQGIIVAYERLKTAFGEHNVSPEAAKNEVANAGIAVDKARTELAEGMKLLR